MFGLIRAIDGVITYECDFCHKTFQKRCYIVRHRRIHTGEKSFECDTCEKRFAQRGDLLRHIRTHGDNLLVTKKTTGAHRCDLCDKSYSTMFNLKRHIRSHGTLMAQKNGESFSRNSSIPRFAVRVIASLITIYFY